MITIKDISKACNVSRVTVIRALNDHDSVAAKTKKRVLDVAKQLGYRPNAIAKQLQSGKTNTVALVVNECVTGYVGRLLEGVQQELSSKGYDSLTYEWAQLKSDGASLANKIMERRAEGVLMIQWGHEYEVEFFQELSRFGLSVVSIDREADYGSIPCIVSDEVYGVKLAIDYLASMGHEKIGHIGGVPEHSSSKDRLIGFYSAMAEHNLATKSAWIVAGDYRYAGAAKAIENFFDTNDELPTAIFAGSDVIAATFIQIASQKGIRVPEDISVVGFCDEAFAEFLTPALTTVRQKPLEIARLGVDMLINAIEAKSQGNNFNSPYKTKVPVSFIERKSVERLVD